MAFELETPTTTKVLDVRTLAKKDRKPDENAGAQLLLSTKLSAGVLAMFDGFLPGMLFRKATGQPQGQLDGVEGGEELTKIGEHVKRLKWDYEQTGCEAVVHFATTGLQLSDCKVHRVSLAPQQGGGVTVQWTLDAPALADNTRGRLSGLKATEIQLSLRGPQLADEDQQQLPTGDGEAKGENWPFPKGDKPPADGADPVLDAAREAHGLNEKNAKKRGRTGAAAH